MSEFYLKKLIELGYTKDQALAIFEFHSNKPEILKIIICEKLEMQQKNIKV